jgi:cystathionine beta-lyase/cystathionine gamma-synthase
MNLRTSTKAGGLLSLLVQNASLKLRKFMENLKSVKSVAGLISCSLRSALTIKPMLYRVFQEKTALIRVNVPRIQKLNGYKR